MRSIRKFFLLPVLFIAPHVAGKDKKDSPGGQAGGAEATTLPVEAIVVNASRLAPILKFLVLLLHESTEIHLESSGDW